MMRSMFSAVSGLKAHQTKMDVIGNNIANVNTVAFKSQSVTFSDVYYQTTQTATGPNTKTGAGGTNPMQIGTGSSVASISTAITTQGASERTDSPYDLQISGDAFFIVNNQGNTYFTRAGNFKLDEEGALVTSEWAGRWIKMVLYRKTLFLHYTLQVQILHIQHRNVQPALQQREM